MGRFSRLEFSRDDAFEREVRSRSAGVEIDASFYHREAEDRFREGRFEKALRLYSRALEHNPAMAEAWVGQVRMLLELGENDEARLWADKALELFRNHPDLLAAKAVALARSDRPADAMKLSDLSLAQKGESAWVWQARGEVLLASSRGNDDFCFMKAVALHPKDWFVRVLIARIYRLYRRFAQAMKWLQEAISINASSAFAWVELAGCQEAVGMTEVAYATYTSALGLDPECPGASAGLISLGSQSGWTRLWRRTKRLFRRTDAR